MGIISALSDSQITPRSNSALGDWHATLRQACGKLGQPTWLAISLMKTWGVALGQWQPHNFIMAHGLWGACIAFPRLRP